MKNKKIVFILLSLIVIVAALLRFVALGSNPPSLNWDEVAWGYNAYTLGVDGKDEFGVFLPYKYLESYGDFKPPLYAYLAIIPVKIFGLTEFAVRFPSAFFGVLTVLLAYFLVKEIFYSSIEKKVKQRDKIVWVGLCASLFLAISPWHIMLSRAAFEANVASFFIVLGVFSFLKAVNTKPWFLVLSAVSFALSFYTFNTARIVAPLLVLVLAVISIKFLWQNKKQSIVATFIGALLILPLVPFLLSPQANLRFREVNIFSDISIVETSNQKIANDDNAWWSKVINNRRVGYAQAYVKHYLDHFDPTFLFISGDVNPRFSTQQVGQLYLWDIVFLGVGIVMLIRLKQGRWWLLFVWFAIGIIPAATARETPHALRIETVLPTAQIIVAYGFVSALWLFKQKKFKAIVLLIILGINMWYFLYGYTTHYSKQYSGEWQYGYKQAAEMIREKQTQYDAIYVTSQIGRPYIYFLFYNKVDPEIFRKDSDIKRDTFGFVSVDRYQNMYFGKDLPEVKNKNNLYINTPQLVPPDAKVLNTVHLLDGKPIFVMYTL